VIVENVGNGLATAVELVDTFPDGTIQKLMLGDLEAGASKTETFNYVVPFPIADLTLLTNTVTVTGQDLNGNPDQDPSNNTASASTVAHTPVLEFSKAASPVVNAGEAIIYTVTYENTGSGDAEGVVVVDVLPVDVYYSWALDQGQGPLPDITPNADGTTTLTWLLDELLSGSGMQTLVYTARPSLLFLEGDTVSNDATLDFTDGNANDYPALMASATTTIDSVPPTRDPKTLGFWRNHSDQWTGKILARIQATDDRFDGMDGSSPDGALSAAEVEAALSPGDGMPAVLEKQLIATYFNLATRRINAGTTIESRTATRRGVELENVRDAVLYAVDTLSLPADKANRDRYSDATSFLDEINENRSEIY
jgi:uncharacterized repeat protein (TIGR01451 family)